MSNFTEALHDASRSLVGVQHNLLPGLRVCQHCVSYSFASGIPEVEPLLVMPGLAHGPQPNVRRDHVHGPVAHNHPLVFRSGPPHALVLRFLPQHLNKNVRLARVGQLRRDLDKGVGHRKTRHVDSAQKDAPELEGKKKGQRKDTTKRQLKGITNYPGLRLNNEIMQNFSNTIQGNGEHSTNVAHGKVYQVSRGERWDSESRTLTPRQAAVSAHSLLALPTWLKNVTE